MRNRSFPGSILCLLAFSACTSALPDQASNFEALPALNEVESHAAKCQQSLLEARVSAEKAERLLADAKQMLAAAQASEARCVERSEQIKKLIQRYEWKLRQPPPAPVQEGGEGSGTAQQPHKHSGPDPEYSKSDAPVAGSTPPPPQGH